MRRLLPLCLSLPSFFLASLVGCSSGAPLEPPTPSVGSTSEALANDEGDDDDESSAAGAFAAFGVDFKDCSEIASITKIPVVAAKRIVPTSFALGGDASGAPFVVRVANCASVSVAGHRPHAGTVAQIGVSIVPPDGTGNINNYTGFYYTTSGRLARRLRRIGVPAQHVERIEFDYNPNAAGTGGLVSIAVRPPGDPTFTVLSTVVEPVGSAVPFEANWWQATPRGKVKMNTPIPVIYFGGATSTLETPRHGALGELLGASTVTSFPFLDSFNRFPGAHMTVSLVP